MGCMVTWSPYPRAWICPVCRWSSWDGRRATEGYAPEDCLVCEVRQEPCPDHMTQDACPDYEREPGVEG